jgi:hypothetical protein
VFSLLELAASLFQDITSQDWRALQALLGRVFKVAWITVGATCPTTITDGYSNKTTGLIRTIGNELTYLNISVYDIECVERVTARYIAEVVLRHGIVSRWESTDASSIINNTQHTEVALRNGLTYVPRICSCLQPNHRSNSRHHKVQEHLRPSGSPIEIIDKRSTDQCTPHNIPPVYSWTTEKPTASITAHFSTLFVISIEHLGTHF